MPTRKIFLFLLLLLAMLPLRGDTDWLIDSRENWDVIIRQFHDTIDHTRKSLKANLDYFNQELLSFDEGIRQAEKRSGELYYLFWDEGNRDVMAILMYAKQILDLKTGLDFHVKELQESFDEVKEDMERSTKLKTALTQIARSYLSPQSFAMLAECKQQYDFLYESLRQTIATVEPRLTKAKELQKKVDALYNASNARRNEIMQQIIFTRGNTFFKALPTARLALNEWWGYLWGWLEIEIPDNPDFWRKFILIILFAGIPVFWFGKLIFNALAGLTSFPDQKKKLLPFMFAWGLLVVSFLCLPARKMLGLVEGVPFMHIGQFLFALAWLLLALNFRCDRKTARRCLWLHTPLILQHIGGVMLCILVVPYTPLTLILPLLTLPVMVTTAWLLFRLECPLLDRVFGVLTVCFALATTILASMGWSYIGFTIIMVWFVTMAGVQAGIAVTELVKSYVIRNAERRIISSMLLTLLVPAIWLFIICALIYWTAGMYNRQALLQHLLVSDFLHCEKVIEINLIDVLVVVVVALVLQFVISMVKEMIAIIFKDDTEMGLVSSFVTLGTYLAWAAYVIFVLVRFDVHYSGILVVLGGMSLGIGFGMKELVENFISGIILLAGRQLRPGDTIEYNGIWGKVKKVSIRATVVETSENAIITLPNSHILAKDFHNWTLNNTEMRRDIKVGIAYGSNIGKARELMLQAARETPGVLKTPSPLVLLYDLGDNGINFCMEIWVHVANRKKVPSQVREEIERIFKKNGIIMSSPQLEVHLDKPIDSSLLLS